MAQLFCVDPKDRAKTGGSLPERANRLETGF